MNLAITQYQAQLILDFIAKHRIDASYEETYAILKLLTSLQPIEQPPPKKAKP